MENYSFIPANEVSAKDTNKMIALLKSFFAAGECAEQIPINEDTRHWITTELPECCLLIKHGESVVGSTFILPCTKEAMRDFISCNINEAILGERMRWQKINYSSMEAIYLCSALIRQEYQGRGLATYSLMHSIKQVLHKNKKLTHITLFYWAYSTGGKKLAEQVAEKLGFPLLARSD